MYIVGFNGPPRSGKDSLAEMLADHMDKHGVTLPVRFESLSMPLRQIAYAMTGWTGELDGPNYELFKATQFAEFNGKDGRHIMIDVSESFLKPTYGIEIMAQMLLARNSNFYGIILIRDCGFQIEVDPIETFTGVENLYMVNTFREGCDFSSDSREYVHTNGKMHQVYNNGTLDDLRAEAGRIYGRLVNQLHWKL